ncbi:hypothetical protein ACWFMI_13780 [Nocardiopsis terrae]
MRYDEFLAEVRELGEYRDQQEAEQEFHSRVAELLGGRALTAEQDTARS